MKIALSITCLALSACAQSDLATIAIRDVTVVDVVEGSLRTGQTVLVAGNRITAAGRSDDVEVPRGSDVVDATGQYLIPGLWDMHTHALEGDRADGASRSFAAEDWHLPLFLAHGVTGVRNMNDDTADLTLALTNRIKRELVDGSRRGPPRFLSAGPSIGGHPLLGTRKIAVRTEAEARTAVAQLAAHGADLVKVYENLSREAYFTIIEEARRHGIPVDGHLPFRLTVDEAARAGQRTLEHPDSLAEACSSETAAERERFARVLAGFDTLPDDEKFLAQFHHTRALYDSRDPVVCAAALETLRRHGVAVTVDLVAYHHVVHAQEILADNTLTRLVPAPIRREWEDWATSEMAHQFQSILRPIPPMELELVGLAHDAGVLLLAGTDVGVPLQVAGISLHEELERLVAAGLSELAALQTATLNPVRVLGLADALGTIEAGKLADLVLLDANPLQDIRYTRRIRAVVADGRLYRRSDLERLLSLSKNLDAARRRLDPQGRFGAAGVTVRQHPPRSAAGIT